MTTQKSFPPRMLERLYQLSDLVEENGGAAIYSSSDGIFSVSQAETYQRYYEGLKRMEQWDSIKGNVYAKDSPYYGWGPLVYHDPVVVYDQATPQVDPEAPKEERRKILDLRKDFPGRLEIHKRTQPCPTISMWVQRALAEPIYLPSDITHARIASRLSRMQQQNSKKDPELTEKLYQLKIVQRAEGLWMGIERYTIQKI